MGYLLGTPGAADKNQSLALLWELISLADGQQISFKAYRLRESLNCLADCLLKSGPLEYWPLEWGQPCGAMKMAKSCKEGVAAKL